MPVHDPPAIPRPESPYVATRELPPHLQRWQLPPDWSWGSEGLLADHRHYQEVVDALGRSLSLVTAPDPAHARWLYAEARHLAHLSHPSVPTTYHYWTHHHEAGRGPGYLRRWIAGETVGARLRRGGAEDVPFVLQVLRGAGSALAYLHDASTVHGALGPDTVWTIPSGRLWLIGWQWALPRDQVPPTLAPERRWMPVPPEWPAGEWAPDTLSDQWQLAAICFAALVGELPPERDIPPVGWVRPDCPQSVAAVLDRALSPHPEQRHPSVAVLLRELDRAISPRTAVYLGAESVGRMQTAESEEARLRWATGDDYDVLSRLGSGTFGSVWRVRDLALEREVALKMLHEHVARDDRAVSRFRREARLAAQLAHPGIVPIYDWDSRGEVSWYTMELAEGGSVAQLVAQMGARPADEIAEGVDLVLDALVAAHAVGVIHRDLKPENVLIDRYRRWRLADFGIANAMGEELGGASGTPQFAAPEQLLGEPQGPAVDCFAVAAIVYFVLTGRVPFGGADGRQILARQLSGDVDVSFAAEPIADWLRRGLSPDPSERFDDAQAMRRAWRDAVDVAARRERSRRWWRELLGG
ncbi:MAG TPA: serine/threonine-protein kinase [Gemmatimonadaceae bacterium]|nr:serine/threonine-protein kinase [Gemmatimonadaceae bacterium]